MNIAYLDPPYSRYFQALAGALAARTGGRCVALLSSPAYRLYTGRDRALVWEPDAVEAADRELCEFPAEFARARWARVQDAHFRAAMASAVQWFRHRFIEERTEFCLVFSDARPFSVAARLAAQELGVVCLYFERGAFRYKTASLSTLGLNSRFSLRRACAATTICGMAPEPLAQRRPIEPWLRLRFTQFLLRHTALCLLDRQRQQMQHKRYAIGPYLRLVFAQWWGQHHRPQRGGLRMTPGAGPLVILPLQLESDSQLVLHSPFSGNQEFLDVVSAEVRRHATGATILVKRHPMDAHRYRLPAGVRWVGGNLGRFFEADPLVVCVNSTVGFEAAVHGVRVICFGASFYDDAEHLICTSRSQFGMAMRAMLQRSADPDAGAALRSGILRWYQSPGDVWAFTGEDIESTAEIVLQHYRAARGARAMRAAMQPALRVAAIARASA
jgi:capsular polysaccharide export protein